MSYDIIVKNGLYFDGSGAPGALRHLGIRAGRLDTLSASPLDEAGCPQVLDAAGKWVTPGFLEIHSHYDAEVIAAPALKESVRHGVTTVALGSCSISMVLGEAEDCSDLFTRVEAVPRDFCRVVRAVLPAPGDASDEHVGCRVQVDDGLRADICLSADRRGGLGLRQGAREPVEHVAAAVGRRGDHPVLDQGEHQVIGDEVAGFDVAAQLVPERGTRGCLLTEDVAA